jgi:hypothetical protein
VCTDYYGDETLTNNADFTGCSVNEALVSQTFVESVLSQGAALWGAFIVAGTFACMAVYVYKLRSKKPDQLANHALPDSIYYAFLPGFSAGSELFFVTAMIAETPAIGVVMLLFRLLHPIVGIWMAIMLFGPASAAQSMNKYIKKSSSMRNNLDADHIRDNSYSVWAVTMFSMADLTMLQFLPWKKVEFYVLSLGYPTMTIMKICMGTKTLQSIVSVCCELSYLFALSNSTTSNSSMDRALLILNIFMGVGTVVMDLVMLCLRGEILRKSAAEKSAIASRNAENEEEWGSGSSYDGSGGEGGVESPFSSADGGDSYPVLDYTANPLHSLTFSDNTTQKQQQGGTSIESAGDGDIELAVSDLLPAANESENEKEKEDENPAVPPPQGGEPLAVDEILSGAL